MTILDILHISSRVRSVFVSGCRRMPLVLCLAVIVSAGLLTPVSAASRVHALPDMPVPQNPNKGVPPDSTVYLNAEVLVKTPLDYAAEDANDTIQTVVTADDSPYGLEGKKEFNPSPTRAVWMSALFPGLGQVYNRRFWKLPIVVGGFMGLGYATSWNNNQLNEYTQAYRDLTDDDPSTKSYMNFFPPTTTEGDLDKNWLTNTMRTRRDFYRRNRDLCIICCVGMYLLCMVDAYVDASLAHFDISPDLSIDWSPAMMVNPNRKVSVGLNWALTF